MATVGYFVKPALIGAGIGLGFDLARNHYDWDYKKRPFYQMETVKGLITALALAAISFYLGQKFMIAALVGTLLLPLLRYSWNHSTSSVGLNADHPGDLLIWRVAGLGLGLLAGRYLYKL